MFGINKKERFKQAVKSSGKKLVRGDYEIKSKLNRVGSAARTVRSDFINDFNSDGPSMRVSSEHGGSPFRMGDTAEVLPALRNPQRPKQKKPKRRPRKVVYY